MKGRYHVHPHRPHPKSALISTHQLLHRFHTVNAGRSLDIPSYIAIGRTNGFEPKIRVYI